MKELTSNELMNINGGVSRRLIEMAFSIIGIYNLAKRLRRVVFK